jgi:ribosome-binding protein aMBF1 (putative translation factor)
MARNAFEEFFGDDLADPRAREQYEQIRSQIDAIDNLVRALDDRRKQRSWSKAELARHAGLNPAVVRRLFSQRLPNPTLQTIAALADALGVQMTVAASDALREVTADDSESAPAVAQAAR